MAQQERLKGKAIEPQLASQHMDLVEFDGIGRIMCFKTHDVPPDVLEALEAAEVTPLTHVNSSDPREHAKTERDSVVQFMALLRRLNDSASRTLFDEGKALWLAGDFVSARAGQYFGRAVEQLSHLPHVRQLALQLQQQTGKEKTRAEYHDNLYGRKFDTELAHELIKNPPPSMLDASREIGQALVARLNAMIREQDFIVRTAVMDAIVFHVRDDRRQWFSQTPDLSIFSRNPSMNSLKAMLGKVETGFDVLKVAYLAVKISLGARFTVAKPWMWHADANMIGVVEPARSTHRWIGVRATRGYGIRLSYQPEYDEYMDFEPAKSWSDAKVPRNGSLTGFEQNAMAAGHPVVCGASGSTNITSFLLHHLHTQDPHFADGPAMLGTMSFLVFDGGHSANEVMGVYDAIAAVPPRTDTRPFDRNMLRERSRHMASYRLDYQRLVTVADSPDTARAVEHAMDAALEKTLDYFDEHSYFASQNNEIVKGAF
ncbi:hypothetical protein [Paraburkholderia aspalathi]|uniref:hypothetical protein n=1 Tax=Paraburkholderia aspalathi TaxID=1324617 RepID=UPI00190DDDD0|nr:hypothetical protein [Paraburkholderia aspalathi]MBK3844034.1 hypothetical protein [Paraburkholderia aspalathi]